MNLTCLIFGFLFSGMGVLFAAGRCHIRLTAWKRMTEEEKNKIRIRPLCRNIGAMIGLCGGIFLMGGIWSDFKEHAFVGAMFLWMAAAGLDLYHMEKGRWYSC